MGPPPLKVTVTDSSSPFIMTPIIAAPVRSLPIAAAQTGLHP